MSRPLRVEYPGAVYHVIARGNERKAIFRDVADREKYLDRLGVYAGRFAFSVYAYCLMTNHVHLALEVGPDPLSRIMRAFHGSYSQAFNRRHARVGHLFQGRYKAFLIQSDKHLLTLVRYIHLNPVKARLVTQPQEFQWSSDRAYRGGEKPSWLSTSVALSYLSQTRRVAMKAYASFMNEPTGARYEDLETYARLVKGDEEFAVRIGSSREPEVMRRSLTAEQVGRVVSEAFGLDSVSFRAAPSYIRAVTGYLGRTVGRIPLCRIAELFGKHETSIVKDVRRLETDLKADANLRRVIDDLRRAASNSGIQR